MLIVRFLLFGKSSFKIAGICLVSHTHKHIQKAINLHNPEMSAKTIGLHVHVPVLICLHV